MGKVVKAIVGVAVAVVGVVTGNPLLIAQGLSMTLGAVLQKSNAGNKATNGRLSKRLEPEDFRKIVFGKTAGGADLRYWETWGSDYTKFDEVIAVATHTIHSFQETYIEEELVGLSGGAATGTYAGTLSVLQTTTGGHLSAGAGSLWGASQKMTGIPHYVFRWTYSEKKLPQGIPSRYTRVIEGALVYDPRRDSTRGGSGTHRADDQSTWEYAPLDSNNVPIGRNNALQMLWYLIGWRINSKLVAGRGVDLSDIDFEGFIAAANDCETQEYYTDMILSTGDNHTTNEGIISADGLIGELLDAGGLWTYHITRNDVAEVSVALDDDDVVEGGSVSWVPFKPMSDKFNEVAGTYVDPSPTSLFQARAYPTVSDSTYYAMDNYKKRKSQVFQCVQDVALAQKLGRIMLNRARYQGEFSATFNLRALRAKVWSIVWLSLERFGFEDKPFRVIRQAVSAQGVEMVLREEEVSIYTGGTVIFLPTPAQVSKYDPRIEIPVTGLASITQTKTSSDTFFSEDGLQVSWNVAPGNVRRTEVQFRKITEAYWTSAYTNQASDITAYIGPVLPDTEYSIRVRHISTHEVAGPWAYITQTSLANSSLVVLSNLTATKSSFFYGFAFPALSTSQEHDTFIHLGQGKKAYRRVAGDGLIAIGGSEITIAGQTIELGWTPADDDRIGKAILDAAGAAAIADGKVQAFVTYFASDPVPVAIGQGDIWVKRHLDPAEVWTANAALVWEPSATYGATSGQIFAIETAQDTAEAAQADATTSLTQIGLITNDGTLDKSEKPDVVLRYNALISEQAGIQGNAVYYGITTERTAYDAAVTALTAYLTGLSPAYNNYAADTAITRATFNATWKDAYDKRQILLNKIAEEASRNVPLMTLASTANILCDYQGTPKAGQLPRTLANGRSRGNVRVDNLATWGATFPASITGTIDSTATDGVRGDLTLTAVSGEGEITVTSTYDAVTLTDKIKITRTLDPPPPPPPVSGAGQALSSADQSTQLTTYPSTGLIIGPVAAGSAGQIRLEAYISFNRRSHGTNGAFGKWGRSTSASGPFTDIAAGEVASSYDAYRFQSGFPEPELTDAPGALSINQVDSGLTNGTDYWYEFRIRKNGTNNSAWVDFYGTKTVTRL